MIVKELIEVLQKMNPELTVRSSDVENGYVDIISVKETLDEEYIGVSPTSVEFVKVKIVALI
jgi:hypothetical protein